MNITSMPKPAAPIVSSGPSCVLSLIAEHRTAPVPAPKMGSTSVFGTGNFGPNAVNTDVRVRDAKQAAPPRGELR